MATHHNTACATTGRATAFCGCPDCRAELERQAARLRTARLRRARERYAIRQMLKVDDWIYVRLTECN